MHAKGSYFIYKVIVREMFVFSYLQVFKHFDVGPNGFSCFCFGPFGTAPKFKI